ncbi:putative tRNA acetyltransferase ASCRUDRAFT_81858 [Ascoidea rubescens DSM 1968]|uniref:THUMP domain-containing protein n=1 Tax=Ascoidea rubescens DSM 1968 TaxID=1344418 RepID=A0A1D2VDE5_9ASCO|nr:hypothetical protein ASCRUDRAFT_81858 [Ascoidea rubescens DSM 1968]ODV59530.1 hypothetical protein ASCRUDRAFT_81858 [Ascoidea rubescens DSM 1968]
MSSNKRKPTDKSKTRKKYKFASSSIDPGTIGCYATCQRNKEPVCRKELLDLFAEKFLQFYPATDDSSLIISPSPTAESLSIEDSIKNELKLLNPPKNTNHNSTTATSVSNSNSNLNPNPNPNPISTINLECDCLNFFKFKKPIIPTEFIEKICNELFQNNDFKKTKYTFKLIPMDYSCSASLPEIKKLISIALDPVFNSSSSLSPISYNYTIQFEKRNFNLFSRDDLTNLINDHISTSSSLNHNFVWKNYDKTIIVSAFKNNFGLAVVNNYSKLSKFNLQQIFLKSQSKET